MGPTLVILMAPASLGFVVGMLTGQTGADVGVVAAVLSAVVTGAGGALLAAKITEVRAEWTSPHVLASASVASFAIFLIIGLQVGFFTKRAAALEEIRWERRVLREEVAFRRDVLATCTYNEISINALRNASKAKPYPLEEYCPQLAR